MIIKPDPFFLNVPRCLRGYVEGINQNKVNSIEKNFYNQNIDLSENKPSFIHYKAVLCGKEFCPDCGLDNSWIHQRRKSRWYPKALQWKEKIFGYLVVTFPKEIRKLLEEPELLSKVRTYFRRKLKREGYEKGLGRWHWFGDCPYCKGEKCSFCKWTGAGSVYKPHLNFLFEGGHISKQDFKIWRSEFSEAFTQIIKKYWRDAPENLKLNVNFHYQYFKPGEGEEKKHLQKIFHKVEYVTRSTFKIYNSDLAIKLKGYRNTFSWGKWKDLDCFDVGIILNEAKQKKEISPEEWRTQLALSSYGSGFCPISKEIIVWDKFYNDLSTFKILTHTVDFFEGGYFVCSPEIYKENLKLILKTESG